MIAKPDLTVLIPAYNEEQNLPGCVHILEAQLQSLGVAAEILIIDDGSRDSTGQIADRLAIQNDRVRAIHHTVNKGIGAGFLTGVANARGKWLVMMPADLAFDPADLHKYLAAAPLADIVVGMSTKRVDYTWLRRVISWLNINAIRLLFGMPQRQFNYISLFRVDLLRQIEIEYASSAFFYAEIMIKARTLGRQLSQVEINYRPRTSGRATGANWRLIARTARHMLGFRLRTLWPRSVST